MTVTKIPTESGGYEIAGERERVVQGYTQSILDTIEGAAIDRQIAMLSDAIRPLFSLRNDLYGAERNRKKAEAEPEPETGTEAALAVQPAPTDAEIEAAIEEYGVYKHKLENARDSGPDPFVLETYEPMMNQLGVKVDDARANLLRLIAAQREAAAREALESVREYVGSARLLNDIINQKGEPGFWPGVGETRVALVRHIDAMLAKEAGHE